MKIILDVYVPKSENEKYKNIWINNYVENKRRIEWMAINGIANRTSYDK